jgi:hypothetical protein
MDAAINSCAETAGEGEPMKIDPTGLVGTRPTQRRSKTPAARSGDFAGHIEGGASAGAPVGGGTPVNAVDALLALQEVGDSTSEQSNARARARGRALLDRLDEIRHGLLAGGISKSTLNELTATVRSKRAKATSPELAEVLDEIELRAEVELAKIERQT